MASDSKVVRHTDEDGIRALLLGRTVTKIAADELLLDDGTHLTIVGNDGCGGCAGGHYNLSELNDCPTNAIMAVEFDDAYLGEYDERSYRVFVLAADRRIKLVQVDGDDGSGYYGTGYWIEVRS